MIAQNLKISFHVTIWNFYLYLNLKENKVQTVRCSSFIIKVQILIHAWTISLNLNTIFKIEICSFFQLLIV